MPSTLHRTAAATISAVTQRGTRRLVLAAAVAGAVAAGCGGSSTSGLVVLKWYTGLASGGSFEKAAAACSQQSNGKYRVEVVGLPRSTDAARELLVRRLAAKDSDISIIGMDVIWTPELAEAGWLKRFDGANATAATAGRLAGPLASATWKGALYAVPAYSNAQLLWYRKDLVATPPRTWTALIAAAKKLPSSNGLIQEQGARYEGLVVWFNSLVSSAGGTIVDPNTGKPTLGPAAVQAAQIIHDVATSGRADPSLSTDMEDQGRLAFESGNSAFMLNWPFVYASAKADAKASAVTAKVFANMAWAPYPSVVAGKPSRVSIGGANFGVSAYASHPDLAQRAALCLASPQNQILYATVEGFPPAIGALYDRPAVQKSYPFAVLLRQQINDSVIRPPTPYYNDVSLAIADTLSPPSGINPASTIKTLKDRLSVVLRGGMY